MKRFTPYQCLAIAVAAMVLVFGPMAVSASPPSDVADLVGARGSSGEMGLANRGYSNVTMSHGVQYWWNAERKSCIGIKVAEGRYKSITSAAASHCDQQARSAEQGTPASMKYGCTGYAAAKFSTASGSIEVKYEGQRTDETHAVNGTYNGPEGTRTFQCNYDRSATRMTKLIVNE